MVALSLQFDAPMAARRRGKGGEKDDFRDSLFVRGCRGRGGVQVGDAGRDQGL